MLNHSIKKPFKNSIIITELEGGGDNTRTLSRDLYKRARGFIEIPTSSFPIDRSIQYSNLKPSTKFGNTNNLYKSTTFYDFFLNFVIK